MQNFAPQKYYSKYYTKHLIRQNIILYESRDGSVISDSPLALFLSIVKNEKFSNFQHIWVIRDNSSTINLINIPEELHSKIFFVERNSKAYVEYMLTAKYLITNSTFQSWFSKKEGQVYINTWHGTPMKAMGFDIANQLGNTQNVLRNLLMTDYFLSPNAHTTEIFSGSGYKMRGIYEGEVLESGYPRIDLTKDTTIFDAQLLLKKVNVVLDSSLPVVVYMPTWRGNDTQNPSDSIAQVIAEVGYLRERFSGKYNIVLKVHPYLYQKAIDYKELDGILINDAMDANLVLAATDILITDFSSVFFDYLVTDKPIIFYGWDQDLYEAERGMYLDMLELPGPILKTVFEIADYLHNIDQLSQNYHQKYQICKQKFVPYDDGNVSDRVVDYIFNQEKSDQLVVKKINNKKKKLLVYPGNLDNNGITNSFINLTNIIDYHNYDVTVFVNTPNLLFLDNYKRLNQHIRLIFRTGAPNFTKLEQAKHDKANRSGSTNDIPKVAFARESSRLFSGVDFDIAIDFSGYSFYWSKYIAFSSAKKKIIFQHNDLYEEMSKEIDGKMPHAKLTGVFELYCYFNKVISVSEALKEINAQKLARYVNRDQLDFLPNLISFDTLPEQPVVSNQLDEKSLNVEGTYVFNEPSVTVYKHASDDSDFQIVDVSDVMTVKIIALIVNQDQKMAKISIDNIYYGWIKFFDLTFSGYQVLEEKKVKSVASFIRKKNTFIYTKSPLLAPDKEEVVVTESKYAPNQYWYVDKLVQTKQVKFAYISNKMGIKGWVHYDALNRFHSIKNKPHLAVAFYMHNLRNQVITSDKLIFDTFYFKLKPSITAYYTMPAPFKLSKVVNASVLSQEESYSTDEQQFFKGKGWIKAYRNKQFIGWISDKDIERIDSDIPNEISQAKLTDVIEQMRVNKDDNVPQFINVGRLSPEKNQKLLIETFSDLIKSGVNAKLYIMGSGILEAELRAMIIDHQLTNSVMLLGQVDHIVDILKLMDYFVFPSEYEGQGMALLEAMSMGLTPITSDIPTSREILKAGYYGIICKTNDKKGLLNAMKKALSGLVNYPKFDLNLYNEKTISKINQLLES
ncbi:CDP-glycerol glycerophosphotransferase family protein [Lactococcus carnosus]|uniref:CDP-glycerol glycerophosphotransferase family protein n=1 Tax=Pseudolactococcus carnosus TaxID=2749961 RepID=UPI001FBB5BAA|nr:CDP-glycerol glycerophosphotransferase family protein [Lactococcus carnosus]MCJ1972900.1 glycosyltransferase [Lactococcus carnosus]